jgi:hypothetical protein
MRIISAYVVNFVPTHSLESNPNVGLNVFHQVTNMNLTIGIREG